MKTIYKGVKELNDPQTGEVYKFDVISKKYDILDKKGWRRVVMADLMAALEIIGNKKIKVLEYLIDNMDSNNQINTNYREISQNTGISIPTVVDTFKALKQCNLIKKHKGVYVLNCSIISSYGSSDKNKYLMLEYDFNGNSIIKDKENKNKRIKELEEE